MTPRIEPSAPAGAARAKWIERGVFLSTLALLSALFTVNARRCFDFFDMSSFMDAGWRVARGQRLYTDFFYNAGPIHPYAHALSFRLFGFTQQAVIAHLLAQVALFAASVWYLARPVVPLAPAVLVMVVATLEFAGPVSHPWYDLAALAYAALAFALEDAWRRRPEAPRAWLWPTGAGVAAMTSFCAKANIGVAATAIIAVLIVIDRRSLRALAGYLAGLGVGALLLLGTLASPAEFFFDTFVAYRPSDRLRKFGRLFEVLEQPHFVLLMGAVLLLFLFLLDRSRRVRVSLRDLFAASAAIALAVFSAWTGSGLVRANVFGVGLALVFIVRAVFAAPAPASGEQESPRLPRFAALALVLTLGAQAALMTEQLESWRWRVYDPVGDYSLHAPGFEGWRCRRELCEPFDAALDFIRKQVPRKETLFVFPESTWAYGLLGRDSWPAAPFIFHLFQVPPPGRPLDTFRKRFLAQPPDWILLNLDGHASFANATAMLRWLELKEWIEARYRVAFHRGSYLVLHRNGRAPLSTPPR